MDKHKVVVIGAGYAGLTAALRVASKARGVAHITLINATETFVERVRLHQAAAGQKVKARRIEPAIRRRGGTFLQGRVTSIQPNAKTLTVQTSGGAQTVAYDTLIYALGSTIERDRVPGVREHAYTLSANGPRSTAELMAELRLLPDGARVTVIGGGLTGIEGATELAETYPALHISLVTRGTVGESLSDAGRDHVRRAMDRLRVDLLEGQGVAKVEADAALLENGTRIPHDVVLWAGAFSVPALARESGLAVNARGQIIVDETFRSLSHSDVYAVGDCAAAVPVSGIEVRMSCQSAMPQGAHAADSIAARLHGREAQPFRFGFSAQCVSLGRRDAVVQFVRHDDSPTDRVLTGWLGATVKELVCKFAVEMAFSESRFHLYRWPQPRDLRQAAHAPAR
jgi:NADH dehydrogenase